MESQRLLSSGSFFCAIITGVCATYFYYRWTSSLPVVPKDISWVPKDLVPKSIPQNYYMRVLAHLRDFRSGTEFVNEGYTKYSKSGKPFIVPSFVTWQPEVVLPPSQIRWLTEQSDNVLSIDKCLIKDLEFEYTAPGAWSFTRPFHVEAINKLRLEALAEDIAEEVQLGIDRVWGLDSEDWREVNIDETMQEVLLHVTTRVFFGLPLSRDPEFTSAAANFIKSISVRAIFISLAPELLRPLVAWYLTRDLRRWTKVCARQMTPLIEGELLQRRSSDQKAISPPKTLLEHISRLAARSTDIRDRDAFSISSRLLALNFVAVHTSNHALSNGLVDILSPPATGEEIFYQLRTEADEIFDQHNGKWSKAAVARLEKIDSALRESLRINTFKARGLERIVVKPEGVILPSGQYLPHGTKIGVPALPIHRDSESYENAGLYDALRFCNPKSDVDSVGARADSPGGSRHTELINTSERFLAFGHGRHACPGRFLAAYELKLIVAYIAMNYEIQPLETRPENAKFSDFSVASMHNLRVRRVRR